MRKTTGAVHAAVETTICLSAIATVAANSRVASKRGGVDDEASAVGEDCATTRSAAVAAVMCTEASGAESITPIAAVSSCKMKCRVCHCHIAKVVNTATHRFTARVSAIATGA